MSIDTQMNDLRRLLDTIAEKHQHACTEDLRIARNEDHPSIISRHKEACQREQEPLLKQMARLEQYRL